MNDDLHTRRTPLADRVNLRITHELREQIAKLAAKEDRSLTAMIRVLLRFAVAKLGNHSSKEAL